MYPAPAPPKVKLFPDGLHVKVPGGPWLTGRRPPDTWRPVGR